MANKLFDMLIKILR